MQRFENQVVFVSGAGAGIGRAAALRFAREGAAVVIAELDNDSGAATADAITDAGGVGLHLPTDVTDEASVRGCFETIADRFGRVDALVNCAGGSVVQDASVVDVDLAVWDHTINLDLKGPFLCCRHGVPLLADSGGGAIVNFTSVVALKGTFPGHIYTAAKGGIISLTQALAGRYWRQNIRANAIAPGIVLSDRVAGRMQVDTSESADQQRETAMDARNRLVDDRHPFGYGVPEDIANIAVFLASAEARMINGAVIPAEGGAAAY